MSFWICGILEQNFEPKVKPICVTFDLVWNELLILFENDDPTEDTELAFMVAKIKPVHYNP